MSRETPTPVGKHLETLASVGGLAGLLGALLYYFGWARTSATFAYFGVGVETLNLSFQDYLLRSVQAAYWPLIVVGLLGLAALSVHGLIARSRAVPTIGVVLAGLGALGILVGATAVARWIAFPTLWPVVPTVLLIGTLLVVYGSRLLGRNQGESRRAVDAVRHVLVGVVVTLLAFWAVSNYASYRGVRAATAIVGDLTDRTGVVVYSEKNLHLWGKGVVVRRIGDADSAYHFCFAGLRVLADSGDRKFLLPEQWMRGRDPIIVLTEGDGLRFEYVRSNKPTTCR